MIEVFTLVLVMAVDGDVEAHHVNGLTQNACHNARVDIIKGYKWQGNAGFVITACVKEAPKS